MMSKQLETYQANAVKTASGPQLTLMLYNGCIRFIKQGIKDLQDKNIEGKNTNLQKAQNIISELMITLDKNVEISQQILPLYEYINHRLTEGNIKNNEEYLNEALTLVTEFRDTWKEVIRLESPKYVQGARV